ncbi:hypothetical protein [Kribbella deserti]|uniref:Uncharacterized protein n=1 Tax=Kribbella deserti TaxID=1926257 RepID=A0ABV6QN55_9ACTN
MSVVEAPEPATGPDTWSTSAAQVARGKELAAALAVALGISADASQTPDVRTALAEAERARREVVELRGHVLGLERTLGSRDKALRARETRIREMRTQVQKANAQVKENAELARLWNSRANACGDGDS